ncbi:hypothetical protein ABPG74_022397 [Tetrahymena malaccensis]
MESQKQIDIKYQIEVQKLSEKALINIQSAENLFKQIQSQLPQFQNYDYFGRDDRNSIILSCFDSQSSQYVALRILRTQGNIWTKVYQDDQVIRIYLLEQDIPGLLNLHNQQVQNNEEKEINLLIFVIRITKKLIQTYSKFYKLTDYIENPQQLKYLADRDSKMKKNQIQNLKNKFQEYTYLQYVSLSFSNSDLNEVSGKVLAQMFSKCDQLFHFELYLAATQIKDQVPQQFIDQISQCISLRYLTVSFSYNQLDNESGLLLGNSISKLQQLYKLELFYNNNYLEDIAAKSIGKGIAQLHNLQYLVLEFQNNKLTVEGVKFLIQSISLMKSLSILTLLIAANRFSYEVEPILLEFIPKCKHLIQLQTEMAYIKFKGQYGVYNRNILRGKRLVNLKLQ